MLFWCLRHWYWSVLQLLLLPLLRLLLWYTSCFGALVPARTPGALLLVVLAVVRVHGMAPSALLVSPPGLWWHQGLFEDVVEYCASGLLLLL